MSNTITKKARNIKYLNRDFSGFKASLVEHLKVYFPDTYSDFNESSIGMMLLELSAYIGDNMSFYLDKRFNEIFSDSATEAKSVFKNAKQLGFRSFGKTASQGFVDAFIEVSAIRSNGQLIPDIRYAGKIKRGAKLKSKNGNSYETLEECDFSKVDISDSSFATPLRRNQSTNEPETFALKVQNISVKSRRDNIYDRIDWRIQIL